jgi:excisionase family DNA binding protein
VMAAYLTAKQVAERLQVSVSWVYKHKRLLGAVQIGERMWRFPEDRLSTLISRDPPPPAAAKRARWTPPPAPAARDWHLRY